MKTAIRLFFLIFFALFFSSCEKKIESSIPNSMVYIETSPGEHIELSIPNSAISYVQTPGIPVPANFRFGFGGVLIYRNLKGEIKSCDLACPVEAQREVTVKVNMPFAECPVCGSKFDLSWDYAVPISGPAKESLRSYRAVERGNSIVVSN